MDTSSMGSTADVDRALDRMLDRYLAGEYSSAELDVVRRELAAGGVSEVALGVARQFFDTQLMADSAGMLATDRALLLRRIGEERDTPSRRSGRRPAFVQWATAAIVIAVLVVGFGVVNSMTRDHHALQTHTYVTRIGERATITLTDGSRVLLAPNSTMSVAAEFGGHARDVALRGEGRFDVVTQSRAPFVVRTASHAIHVLGTTFDVRRYAAERVTRVAVISGKVAVQNENMRGYTPLTLSTGMTGQLSDSSTTVTENAPEYTSWTNGQVAFTNARVGDVLATLGPWYGYEIRMTGRDSAALLSQHVSAVFDINAQRETLRLLRRLLGVTMTIDGSIVTLRTEHTEHVVPSRSTPLQGQLQEQWHGQQTHTPSEVGR